MPSNPYDDFFKQAKELRKDHAVPVKRPVAKNAAKKPVQAPRRAPKKNSGVKWAIISFTGFAVCLILVFFDEPAEKMWNSVSFSAITSLHAGEKAAPTPAQKAAEKSPTTKDGKEITSAEIRQWSDEELSFFKELNEKKAALIAREEELKQLEAELQKRESEIDIKLKKLEDTRQNIAKVLKDRVNTDEDRINKLVQFFSNMKAQKAAEVFSQLDGELAIHVLNKMKKQDAASILNFLDPKKAKEITETFAGYRDVSSMTGEKN